MRIARQLSLSASLIVLTAFGLVNAAPHDEAMAAMPEYQAGLGAHESVGRKCCMPARGSPPGSSSIIRSCSKALEASFALSVALPL